VSEQSQRNGALPTEGELLVKLERVAAFARKMVSGELGTSAARRSTFGQGTLFSEHRHYSAGDDTRFIDWNAFARFDEVFLRVFEPEDSAPISVVVDGSPSMRVGDGSKTRQAALLSAAFCAIGILVLAGANALETSAAEEGNFRGKESLVPMLRFFLRSGRGEIVGKPLALRDALRRAAVRARRGPLVIITDAVPLRELEDALRLRRSRPTLVLHVVDPREIEPNETGLVRLSDPESRRGRRVWITRALRRRYVDLARAHLKEVEHAVLRARAAYWRVSTKSPFDAVVLEALRRGLDLKRVGRM
jgi:uncharacterized protein (DUF58 family)